MPTDTVDLTPDHKAATDWGATDEEGPPEEVGPPLDSLNTRQKRSLEKQRLFLEHFAKCGTVLHAAEGAGLERTTIYWWDTHDHLGFKQRWEQARHSYREAAEKLMDERLTDPTGNRGSDILLMFKLKALYPEKYKDAVVVTDDTAKDLLDRLRRGGKARKPTAPDDDKRNSNDG